jgi:glycosyltransferase involved in cell wall biosynthesis
MVIIEAAAMGLPSIGTKIHGITDAIDDGLTGRLVPVGDVVALANEILLWCSSPNLRTAYSNAGRDRVLHCFDKKKVVRLYVEYFLELFSINKVGGSYEKII